MTSFGSFIGGRNILFTNVRVRQVLADAAEGTLNVKALYDEREYATILYSGVYYSQLDENATGEVILLAEEVAFPEFRISASRASMAVLIAECGGGNEEFLAELGNRGYRLFVHYLGKATELLVIAKQVAIT